MNKVPNKIGGKKTNLNNAKCKMNSFLILECNEYHAALLTTLNSGDADIICPIPLSGYIVDGQTVASKEYPHMASCLQ